MAYDKAKAHEYYEKYRKKGLKKGRKKGKKKTAAAKKRKSTESLVGLSSSGLNDAGKMQAALVKQDLKKKMNEALEKAGSEEEKAKVRQSYHALALQEFQKLKADSKYAQPKKTKATKAKTTKASTGKTSKSTTKKSSSKKKKKVKNKAIDERQKKETQELTKRLDDLEKRIDELTQEQKETVKAELTDVFESLKKLMGVNDA